MKFFRKILFWCHLITGVTIALIFARVSYAQPIPVEFAAASRYASVNVVMSRNFSAGSSFGFFHLNTLVMDWDSKQGDDLTMQGLLFFEPVDNFRITGGAFYGSRPGFNPTAGIQYINAGRKWFILIAPRINIESDPSYSFFSILRFKPDLTEKIKLFTSIQALNLFDANRHIKSYQWTRVGLEVGSTQWRGR